MSNLLNKYRNWIMDVPEQSGDLIACVSYTTLLGSIFVGSLCFQGGYIIPSVICFGVAGIIVSLVYIA
jgi:hypothetical protein